ncbi:hypothetical protein [uncultured Oxalicibacterium sp.]|uniref:hypothetical protein n=1 Tax=uncultured Oxalicibacterium sp. TaxID=1168540 RepID=UPI0025FB1785|nr:hypothetical protein [uncultured Oxalicibacterium sp.]
MKLFSASCVMLAAMAGMASPHAAEPTVVAASASAAQPAQVSPLFQQAVHLRGTIGDTGVQLVLRPKVPAEDGVEGEYFFFGQSLRVLVAGEIAGDVFLLEESQDGTHISGEWDGDIRDDRITGTWMSADGTVTKPFALQIVQQTNATVAVKKKAAKQ